MCNLYRLKRGPAEIGDLFRASAASNANTAGEVYPSYPGLVVRRDGAERVLEAMTWGFPLVLAEARKRAEAAGKVAKPEKYSGSIDAWITPLKLPSGDDRRRLTPKNGAPP